MTLRLPRNIDGDDRNAKFLLQSFSQRNLEVANEHAIIHSFLFVPGTKERLVPHWTMASLDSFFCSSAFQKTFCRNIKLPAKTRRQEHKGFLGRPFRTKPRASTSTQNISKRTSHLTCTYLLTYSLTHSLIRLLTWLFAC